MTALAPAEASALAEYEQQVERGLSTFLDVGRALLAIRDERLYRAEHDTFESYCQERWGMSRQRAHQFIDAAAVSTVVDVPNEAQARELAPLLNQPERLRETWQRVQEQTGGKPTAAAIRNIVQPPVEQIPVGAFEKTVEEFVADRQTGEVLSVEDWQERERAERHAEATAAMGRALDSVPGARDEMERKALRSRWSAKIAAVSEIATMDPEHVRAVLTPDEQAAARVAARGLAAWMTRFAEAGPSGLRVVGGDR